MSKIDRLIEIAKNKQDSDRFHYLVNGEVTFIGYGELVGVSPDGDPQQYAKMCEMLDHAFTPESREYRNRMGC